MSEKDDGGSAFPQVETGYDDSAHEYTGNVYSTGGMSLRDYFAARAMAALMVSPHLDLKHGVDTHECIAIGAYEFADAMLAERSK